MKRMKYFKKISKLSRGADSKKCHLFFYHEEHEGLEDTAFSI